MFLLTNRNHLTWRLIFYLVLSGLDNIHLLTNQPGYSATLAVQITPQGSCFAQGYYTGFFVQNEANNYKMTVSHYYEWHTPCVTGDSILMSGGPGSASGMKFSTPDRDNDESYGNCAHHLESGMISFGDASII